jgi:protein transport protein DSL1/ZW10
LVLSGAADTSIPQLFQDLGTVLEYLSERLPEELVYSLSNVMMPDLIPRIISDWLEPAVPTSLEDMDEFQNIIDATRFFCGRLKKFKYSSFDDLQEWVQNLPRVWLAKCRETALDSIRTTLSQGLGEPKEIERVETQTVSQEEGKRFALNHTNPTNGEAWDAAWQDEQPSKDNKNEEEDDGADAWGWGDDGEAEESPAAVAEPKQDDPSDDADVAEAWGWGDEDIATDMTENDAIENKESSQPPSTHELTLRETYNISSMPEPVLALITAILEDGASLVGYVSWGLCTRSIDINILSSSEGNAMAPAAPGLFSLPTLVLAMFRAVSPYYYSLDPNGNM